MALNKELYKNSEVSGDGFKDLKKGIYICKIIDPIDIEDKSLLKVKFDINEGEFKGYFTGKEKAFGEYPSDGYYYQSYKDASMPYFKGFITAVEKSNTGYNFEKAGLDFNTLKNKLFVGIFGDEEIPFADDSGNPIVKCRLQKVRSTIALTNNELKVPTEIDKLKGDQLDKFKSQAYTDKVVKERQDAIKPPVTTEQQLETAETTVINKTVDINDLPY